MNLRSNPDITLERPAADDLTVIVDIPFQEVLAIIFKENCYHISLLHTSFLLWFNIQFAPDICHETSEGGHSLSLGYRCFETLA